MKHNRIVLSVLGSLLLVLLCMAPAAFAVTPLPEGAVKGLPERLAALDDEGNPVNSATGEYFFRAEDMKLGEIYAKEIQLANLCEGRSYHIYFCVEPLFKNGEIDLEKGCKCRFYYDGTQFFDGNVNGEGNIDLTEYYDFGSFSPGEMHTMRCEIVWDELDVLQDVDNGWRLIDRDGIHVLRGPDGKGYISGEIEFKWIFCAKVDEQDDGGGGAGGTDDPFFPPYTGILLQDGRVWLIGIGVVALLIAVLLVLLRRKKEKAK